MLPRNRSLFALLSALVAATLLAGCTADAGADKVTTDLDAVQVSGKVGERPAVTVPAPFQVEKTERRVISQGKGALVAPGQRVKVDYVGVNGADGVEFDTSFGRSDRNQFLLKRPSALAGWISALSGVPVGSRVLIAVPPKDAYGVGGQPSVGIGSKDTLVFVIDVEGTHSVLSRATGDAVKPKSGLPTVKLAKDGAPTVTIPKGKKAPTKLVTQVLIKGRGAPVKKGQSIFVKNVGVVWGTGRVFYDSWKKDDAALTYVVGEGKLIAGFDASLVGQTVGSQVLVVVPPDKGFGATGQPELQIKGTDTLVFVVDILDAAS
ncbi:FKBP-type peptidyl-prolyl cis-trans isomerase [Spongisporangium articulatum]|uniref:Peptidyl-prolyl cis-trans isomerase n=1 Tax=Spongisporangium articulatum TaxID=3362603 RepID=A0ABW8ARW7_9ACTN